jgi:hypothetical protein
LGVPLLLWITQNNENIMTFMMFSLFLIGDGGGRGGGGRRRQRRRQ